MAPRGACGQNRFWWCLPFASQNFECLRAALCLAREGVRMLQSFNAVWIAAASAEAITVVYGTLSGCFAVCCLLFESGAARDTYVQNSKLDTVRFDL